MSQSRSVSEIALDHVLVMAAGFEQGISILRATTGVTAQVGGEHPEIGTINALAALGGRCYLELLSRRGAHRPKPLIAPGKLEVVDFAMACGDLGALADRARSIGLSVDARDGSREVPGGDKLTWRVVMLGNHPFAGCLPFFIDWGRTPHPSTTSPTGMCDPRLTAFHPRAADLLEIYRALDTDIPVHQSDTPGLRLVATGRHGPFTLTGDARGWRTVLED